MFVCCVCITKITQIRIYIFQSLLLNSIHNPRLAARKNVLVDIFSGCSVLDDIVRLYFDRIRAIPYLLCAKPNLRPIHILEPSPNERNAKF